MNIYLEFIDKSDNCNYVFVENNINNILIKNLAYGFEITLNVDIYNSNISNNFKNILKSQNYIFVKCVLNYFNSECNIIYNGLLESKILIELSKDYSSYKFIIIDVARGLLSKQYKLGSFTNTSLSYVIEQMLPDILEFRINAKELSLNKDIININCYKSLNNNKSFSFYDFIGYICDKYNLNFFYDYSDGLYYLEDYLEVKDNNRIMNYFNNYSELNYHYCSYHNTQKKIINKDSFVINEYLVLDSDNDYTEENLLYDQKNFINVEKTKNIINKIYISNYYFENIDLLHYENFKINCFVNNSSELESCVSFKELIRVNILKDYPCNNEAFLPVYSIIEINKDSSSNLNIKSNIRYLKYNGYIDYIIQPDFNRSEYSINMLGCIVLDHDSNNDEINQDDTKKYKLIKNKKDLYCYVKVFHNNQISLAKYQSYRFPTQIFIPPVNNQKVMLKLNLFDLEITKILDWRIINNIENIDLNHSHNKIDLGFSNNQEAYISSKLQDNGSYLELFHSSKSVNNKIVFSNDGMEFLLESDE